MLKSIMAVAIIYVDSSYSKNDSNGSFLYPYVSLNINEDFIGNCSITQEIIIKTILTITTPLLISQCNLKFSSLSLE